MQNFIVTYRQAKDTVRRLLVSATTAIGVFLFASPVFAQIDTSVGDGLALSDRNPIEIVLVLLSWFLGIIGLLTVIYVLYGGWLWMTSRGEEDQIAQAKRVLQQGVIGLLIIMSAWGITLYVLQIFSDATGTELGGGDGATCVGCSVPSSGSSFYVLSSNPTDQESDVFLCSDITVRMSDYVDTDTVTSDNWYLQVEDGLGSGESCSANNNCASALCQDSQCIGDTIAGEIGFGPGDQTKYFNFIPSQDLPQGTTYLAHVEGGAGGVVSSEGIAMSTAYEWTFTTGSDSDEVPPQVQTNGSSPFPADGEENVCLNTVINFDFNEPMRISSFNDDTAMVLDEVGGDWSDPLELKGWSFGGNFDYASARPRTQLTENSEYSVRLYGGDPTADFAGSPTDSCGNPLDGDFDGVAEGDTEDNYIGYNIEAGETENPITWTTGENASCTPVITSISPTDDYYSDYDGKHAGQSCSEASECSSGVCTSGLCVGYGSTSLTVNGLYLAPHPEIRFEGSVVWAGEGFNSCFDDNFLGSLPTDSTVGDYCLSDDDQEQTEINLRTPVGAADTPIQVEVAGERSEESSQELNVLSPQIDWLSPDNGAPGQYITVSGQNFGTEQGGGYVVMRSEDGARESILELPEACGDVWSEDEVLVVAPSQYTVVADGSTGTWETDEIAYVQVINNVGLRSDLQLFTFSDVTRPNLCSITPSCHDDGGQSFTIDGDNFGSESADDSVYFSMATGVGYEATIASWDERAIVGDTDTDMGDGEYFVSVYDDDTGELSNMRRYEMPCNVGPQVVQISRCSEEEGVYPTPSPRPNSDVACINSNVGVLFDQPMNTSTFTTSTVYLEQYNTGEEFDAEAAPQSVDGRFETTEWQVTLNGEDEDTSNDIDYYGFQYDITRTTDSSGNPSGDLQPNTWYVLTVTNGVSSDEGIAMSETYTQRFKTRDSSEPCEISSVDNSPSGVTMNRYWNGSSVNYQVFTASPYDTTCSLLDAGAYSWDWRVDDTDVGVLTGRVDEITDTDNDQEVFVAGSSTENEGRANVTAAVDSINDSSAFFVDLGYCETDADCGQCGGSTCSEETSRCVPVITDITPTNGDHGTWVTVDGCYFGSATGEVYMNNEAAGISALASYPDVAVCGDTWSNSQLIFEVPSHYDSNGDGAVYSAADVEALELEALESGESIDIPEADNELPEDAYTLQVANFFGDSSGSTDTFTVNETVRPGICSIEPAIAGTSETVEVRGQNLTALQGYATFLTEQIDSEGNPQRAASSSITTWTDDTISGAEVPETAITGYSEADYDEDGFPDGDDGFIAVLSEATDYNCTDPNDPNCSNPLDFQVSCGSNLDCASGCCNASGMCVESSACNMCETDADCNATDRCEYIDEDAGIVSSCVENVCTPVIGEVGPDYGPNERPVSIQGCYFGPYRENYSAVVFDADENVTVDILCLNGWSNEQIIFEAPSETENYEIITLSSSGDEIRTPGSQSFLSGTTESFYVQNYAQGTSNSADFTFTAQCTEDAGIPTNGVPVLCYVSPSSGRAASEDATTEGKVVSFVGTGGRYDYRILLDEGNPEDPTDDVYSSESYASVEEAGGTYAGQYQEFSGLGSSYIPGDGQLVAGEEQYVVEGGGFVDSSNAARASVPYGAVSGSVRVQYPVVDDGITNYCPSNEIEFTVSCTNANDCPGGSFCIEGACVQESCGCNYPATGTDQCGAPTNGCYYDSGKGEGCCAARPTLDSFSITDGEEDVCLNALIEAEFNVDVAGTDDAIALYRVGTTIDEESGEEVEALTEVSIAVNYYSAATSGDDTQYYARISADDGLDPETVYEVQISSEEDGGGDDIRATDTLLALAGGSESYRFTTYTSSCRPEQVTIVADETGESSYTFTEANDSTAVTALVQAQKDDGSYQTLSESDTVSWEMSWESYFDEDSCENVAWVTEDNATDSINQRVQAGTINDDEADVSVSLTWEDTTLGERGDDGYAESEDALSSSMRVHTHFCDADYDLWHFGDYYNGSDYEAHQFPQNFDLFYCSGGGSEDTAVPALELQYVTTPASTDYFLEYFWQNPSTALDDENDAFGIRVYANEQNLTPTKWYEENVVTTGSPASIEIDGYQAVRDGHTYYIAASAVIDDASGTGRTDSEPHPVYNNIYVFTFNDSPAMNIIEKEIMDGLKFNRNVAVTNCEASDKSKLTRDTKRLNDINTVSYQLDEYFEENEEYPLPESQSFGSYLREMTTSRWNSWQGALGNVLGTSLPADPYNTFYASTEDNPWVIEEQSIETPWESTDSTFSDSEQCRYAPDENLHYDQSGTCWDEVNRNYYCPENSHVYSYRVNRESQDQAFLFAHMEYEGDSETTDYITSESMLNPCVDGIGLETDRTADCGCFNYGISTSSETDGRPGSPEESEWGPYVK